MIENAEGGKISRQPRIRDARRPTSDAASLEELAPPPAAAKQGGPKPSLTPEQQEESYTERLLKAKKKAMEGHDT